MEGREGAGERQLSLGIIVPGIVARALRLFLNHLGKFPNKGLPSPRLVRLRLRSPSPPPALLYKNLVRAELGNRSSERGHLKCGGVFVLSHSGREGRADFPTSRCLPARPSCDTVTSSPLARLSDCPDLLKMLVGECVIWERWGVSLSLSCTHSALPLWSGAP